MSVRIATPKDIRDLNYLLRELQKEKPTYFSDVSDISDILKDGSSRVYVIEDESRIFGFSVICESEREAELQMVYIQRDKRGKGYGYELTRATVESIKNKRIIAYVRPSNYEMRKILSKLGFKCEDEGDEDWNRRKAVYVLEKSEDL